jgi:hypothetical protein
MFAFAKPKSTYSQTPRMPMRRASDMAREEQRGERDRAVEIGQGRLDPQVAAKFSAIGLSPSSP